MESYIVAAKRTPMLRIKKKWNTVHASDLGAKIIASLVKWTDIKPDKVIMGNYAGAEYRNGALHLTQHPAKEACTKAGLRELDAFTVNRVCSSGLLSVMLGDMMISSGNANSVLAGGMEAMLSFPDEIATELLCDPFTREMTWDAGEWCASQYNIGRREQDDWAWQSYSRASIAEKEPEISKTLIPFQGTILDEEPKREITEEMIRNAEPIKKGGTITALNSSKHSSAAAGVILMNRKEMRARKIKPLAKILGHATYAIPGEGREFPIAPVPAINLALKRSGLSISDIDLFEINAAFAPVVIYNMRALKLHSSRVNIKGDAISYGHPLGATGSILLVKLVDMLIELGLHYGVVSLCNAQGEATAMVIKNMLLKRGYN